MYIDHPAIAIIYSVLIIVIGNFFIMKLVLAVIIDTFTNEYENDDNNEDNENEIVVTDEDIRPEKFFIEK